MNKLYIKKNTKIQITYLNNGIEKGLNFFYQHFYPYCYRRANRAIQDTCIAESITQEAFLRLWLFRENVHSEADIFNFLKTQIRMAVHAYYNKSRNRFHRSLLQLDAFKNQQEFRDEYEPKEECVEDLIDVERLEDENKDKLHKIYTLLPSLNIEQQLFIKLSLQYSFNYERIAYYLGGISDYEVNMQVEKTIGTLRAILNSNQKIGQVSKNPKMIAQGNLTDEQFEIFHMRYELQLSFEQISQQLQLDPTTVKKLFVEAHSKIKPSKLIA